MMAWLWFIYILSLNSVFYDYVPVVDMKYFNMGIKYNLKCMVIILHIIHETQGFI